MTQALLWYRKAAEAGSRDCMSDKGWLYQIGLGVPEDNAQAFSWYSRAADKGSAMGATNLGYMYEKGMSIA